MIGVEAVSEGVQGMIPGQADRSGQRAPRETALQNQVAGAALGAVTVGIR